MDISFGKVGLEFFPQLLTTVIVDVERFEFLPQDDILLAMNRESGIDKQCCVFVFV